MEWQSLKTSECAARLKTDIGNGLTERQAEQRLREYGRNEIKKAKRKSIFARFISQFSDFMVIILLIAAAVSFITSCLGGEGDMTDSVIILAIVTVDAVIGVVQESKAEKAIDMLKNMSAPHASVIRGGHEKKIKASELVPGDIVTVREGDFVPADLRLTGCVNLKAEESALTGESLPADKNSDAVCAENTPLGDRADMLYSSSSIVSGHGQGIVVETGMDTQVGKIARLIVSQSAPQTPLQRKLAAIAYHMLRDFYNGAFPASKAARYAPYIHKPRCGGHPGGAAGRRYHNARHGSKAHGRAARHSAAAARC